MEFVDKPFADDVALMDPVTAHMAGKIKTDNLRDLQMVERCFPANPAVLVSVAKAEQEKSGRVVETPDDIDPEVKADLFFLKVLPMLFLPNVAGDWESTILFKLGEAGEFTLKVADGACRVVKGDSGDANTTVESEYEDFRMILRHVVLRDSHLVDEDTLDEWDEDVELDMELSDDQLEAIAGGKGGGCGAEASAANACGSEYCGAAAGAGVACGGAACGVEAAAGTACGAAACGAAAGAGGACGADACGAAAGVGTVCGAAACAADASAGAACGAAVGVGACAGDVCGAALGAGVCAGNVCGIDILGGADVGPCGINVIPLVPGT
ncbi:hypothetical protein EOI86_22855 [Hwanghaeella grinnelliae]|uniref:Uncharacterized protein n=1 Tax=Hwanghaeella grinnelliae TaxID=2500179 RepID=A0A3S2W289_9PROT|nr:hypothetical protein [Hwanghaeella grinnelliae]RVU33968.1 hypothetical protein EOI86_22855 [Hwanghaeella grinnelliae]